LESKGNEYQYIAEGKDGHVREADILAATWDPIL
jgi:hypothetical protein